MARIDLPAYLAGIHKRTRRLLDLIPESDIEWRPGPGRMSFGELIRHIAGIERWVYAEVARGSASCYPGNAEALAAGKAASIAYFDALHADADAILRPMLDGVDAHLVTTPSSVQMPLSRWLLLLAEHEIHHRGQLYMLLGQRGVRTPPIFGLTAEQLEEMR